MPAITSDYRSQQKAKEDWDKLIAILDAVQDADDVAFTQAVFEQVLIDIYQLLSDVIVIYPTPNRISLKQTQELIHTYLQTPSGGERMEAICTSLFRTVGEVFGIFDRVEREKVNAADTSTGMSADIECWIDNKIVLLVEVKDRALSLTKLDAKIDIARSRHIAEILFIAREQQLHTDNEFETRIAAEFVSGQNIYIIGFDEFYLGIFILLGEEGRTRFLDQVGKELDRVNASITDRKAWANALKLA